MQLDECVARCRREVQAIAAECRARGQKYCDPDFPPDVCSLYIDGRGPSATAAASAAPPEDLPSHWRRASEGALAQLPGQGPPPDAFGPYGDRTIGAPEVFVPGPLAGMYLLGALAGMRTVSKEPRELVVWREPEVGVYGVRLFKDGEWMYEILDDFLPLGAHGQPACSRAAIGDETQDWLALVEKAYAKVHGSYEAIAWGTEADAMEDVLGMGTNHLDLAEFPIWGELWQHLRKARSRVFMQVAVRRRERPGEMLTSGLISGYGYPLTRVEMVEGEMLCELQNPWPRGTWSGRWGEGSPEFQARRGLRQLQPSPDGCKPFWMSIQDFCKHFTDIYQARMVSTHWQASVVTCSTERPSYPLVSVTSPTQAVFIVTQGDRRWSNSDQYHNAIGLSVYRCRIVAPPQNAVGVKQNVSNPFRNLELLAEKAPVKAHSVVLEVARLEPSCLYIATINSEGNLPHAMLRVFTASAPRFRELSAPESSYFLQAQTAAPPATDTDSFSSQGSSANGGNGGSTGGGARPSIADVPTNTRLDPMRILDTGAADGWREWPTDDAEATIKMPKFLQACIASCSGEC